MNNQSVIARFLHSAAGVLLARVLAFVSVFGFNALLARVLTPGDFGLFILMFSLAGLTALFGCAGMNRAVVKVLAAVGASGNHRKVRSTCRAGLVTGIVGGCVAGIVAAWLFEYFHASPSNAPRGIIAILFALAIWLRTVHLVVAESARGFHEKLWSNLFGGPAGGAIPHIVFLGLLCGWHFLIAPLTLTTVLAIYSVSFAVTLPPLMIKLNRLIASSREPATDRSPEFYDTGSDGSLVMLAIPLMFTQTFGLTMSQADVWIAGAMAAPAALAVYCAAQRMLAFLTIPLQIAGTAIVSFVPELISKKKTEKLQEMVGFAATLAGLPGILIGICFLLFPGWILTIAFGGYYAQAAPLLRILALGQLVCIFTGPCEIVLMMAGHQSRTLVVNLVAAIAIFVLGPLLTMFLGMTGLAIAISLITAIQNLANWIQAKRLLGISTHVGAIQPATLQLSFRKFQSLLSR